MKIFRLFSLLYYSLLLLFLIPSLSLGIVYTQGIAKGLAIVLFTFLLVLLGSKRYKLSHSQFGTAAILAYIGSISLSILPVLNTSAYLHRFKDIVIALMFYFVGILVAKYNKYHRRTLLTLILISIFINTSLKLLLFFFPESIDTIFPHLFYPDYITTITTNLYRDRIYFESFDEIFIPLLFVISSSSKNTGRVTSLLIMTAVTFTSFVSNFRTKFLMLIISFLSIPVLFGKKKLKQTVVIAAALIIGIVILAQLVEAIRGFTVIDRFLLSDETADVQTIVKRKELFEKGMEIGLSSPLYGIGLNQFDYYVEAVRFPLSYRTTADTSRELLADDRRPHDLLSFTFAETGILGLMGILLLFAFFIVQDQKILQRGNDFDKSIVAAFWSLVVFSLFNPAANFSYTILFWILRSHITSTEK